MSKDSIDVSTENLPPTESLAVTSKDEIDVHATTDDATATHKQVVASLKKILNEDSDMETALVKSLNIAVTNAKEKLSQELYEAMNYVLHGHGWPTTTKDYYEYLYHYLRLIPNEKNDPKYLNAWKSNGKRNGYNQKVYDFIVHFYWLIDQKIGAPNQTMQSFEKFSEWLVNFAKAWGAFLDTKESLNKENLISFKHDPRYNFHLYSDNEKNWTTFNEFFCREFNHAHPHTGITSLRPIANPGSNETIVSPADCTYKQYYPIDNEGNVLSENGKFALVSLKGTHSIGSIKQLLKESKYASEFNGGTFIHYFLGPFDYHRFHTPVSGKILEIMPVEGKVYLDVEIQEDGQWGAPDSAEDGYEFTQARGLVIMDAGPVGKVAILPIGMGTVSGVDMYTELKGKTVVKGHEFGKFQFGGSDIIMLFQIPPTKLYIFKTDPANEPIHFQYGQTAVYCKETNEV